MKNLFPKALLSFALIVLSTVSFAMPDNMEQRLAACAQCHGKHGGGIESDTHTPRLAGKPVDYLYTQLLAFHAGKRDNAAMQYVIRQLTPEYLQTIAQYYSQQKVIYQPQPIEGITEAELKRGEQLVKHGDSARGVPACVACHGNNLTGVNPYIPGIVGQPFDYIQNQLHAWRKNTRPTESTHCMWVVATRMQEKDVRAVSAWLANQMPDKNDQPINLSDLPDKLPGWCVFDEKGVSL